MKSESFSKFPEPNKVSEPKKGDLRVPNNNYNADNDGFEDVYNDGNLIDDI